LTERTTPRCTAVHLGPVNPDVLPQFCGHCGQPLAKDERIAYWKVRRQMLGLKLTALKATA